MNVTTELLRALPANLRPNPAAVTHSVETLLSNGWSVQDIAAIAKAQTEPSHVVVRLKDLAGVGGKYQPDRLVGQVGRCQQGCEYGWFDKSDGTTTPCPTCRPDTHHRWRKSHHARQAGADPHHANHVLRDNPQKTPTTYWVEA